MQNKKKVFVAFLIVIVVLTSIQTSPMKLTEVMEILVHGVSPSSSDRGTERELK